MAVAYRILTMRKEALRDYQLHVILCPRHGDIKQPSLLFDFMRLARAEIGWNTPVNHIEHEYRFPLLALCRVNGRKVQVILVHIRHAGLITCGFRWI